MPASLSPLYLPIWRAVGSALVSFKGLVEDQCARFFCFCVPCRWAPGFGGVGVFLCLSVCTKGVADRGSAVCLDMDLLYTLGQGCVSVCVCELGRG